MVKAEGQVNVKRDEHTNTHHAYAVRNTGIVLVHRHHYTTGNVRLNSSPYCSF